MHAPGTFHAVLTTHRDARDALLALAQTGGGHAAAGCTPVLLGLFREYAHFAPHACRDMRYEDIVHGGHGAQARRAYAVHSPYATCMPCARAYSVRAVCMQRVRAAVYMPRACSVRAVCVQCACSACGPRRAGAAAPSRARAAGQA